MVVVATTVEGSIFLSFRRIIVNLLENRTITVCGEHGYGDGAKDYDKRAQNYGCCFGFYCFLGCIHMAYYGAETNKCQIASIRFPIAILYL
ncbi:MAG: hypothetical protein UX14_C0004G0012 [Parcubacteria group bacterium GW2011_GWF1_45_5]|nr:MAG: hypothetical protein UX14_C0004G0012 [Parcubacteria group bacterium GW2011_GWF1_45_5]